MKKDATALEILDYYKSIVWPIIDNHLQTPSFPSIFEIPSSMVKELDSYWKVARDYPERKGKYLRPTVLLLTCQAMGGELESALLTAAAMQLSEEWILMQDDWEDDSLQRRGKEAAHLIHSPKLTINATSGLQTIMWNIIRQNFDKLEKDIVLELMDEFFLLISRTVLGQHVDIDYVQQNKLEFTDEDWFFIADSKTSYYTIAGPIRLGAICANANKQQLETLAEFGIYLGRCFQLIDDLLDVTSDFSGLKQFGNDIYESKRTLILGHLLRTSNNNDKKKLITIISKNRNEKTESEVKWVIEKMNSYKSINYAKELAIEYRNKASNLLDKELEFIGEQPHRTHLKTLMTFILERTH